MTKKKETKHTVGLFQLVGESSLQWNLQIVHTTLVTNGGCLVENITNIHHIRFQRYKDVEIFSKQLEEAIKHKSILGNYEDEQDSHRRRTIRGVKQPTR